MHQGASTVKWIADPCLVLYESDLKLYFNFEFCEGKFHRHLRNMFCKAKQIMLTKQFQEKSSYLKDNAHGVQVGDIEQATI